MKQDATHKFVQIAEKHPYFIESEGSLLCSQTAPTGPYTEPDEVLVAEPCGVQPSWILRRELWQKLIDISIGPKNYPRFSNISF
jgi:hypothetical protein